MSVDVERLHLRRFSVALSWSYLTQSVFRVVLKKSIPAQICKLIL